MTRHKQGDRVSVNLDVSQIYEYMKMLQVVMQNLSDELDEAVRTAGIKPPDRRIFTMNRRKGDKHD